MLMSRTLNKERIALSSLFGPGEVLCQAEGLSEDQVLKVLLKRVEESGALRDAMPALEAAVAGKCCSIVYLTSEIKVFHTRVPGLDRLRIALAINPQGVECCLDTGESALVKLFILVLTPMDEPAGYMRTLAAFTKLARKEGFLERLCAIEDPGQVWEYFTRLNERLPEYVSAGDIMSTDFYRLSNEDSLSTAIDAFCRYGVTELPVVDADGDLVGVVSDDELIHVCLPDYVTWMEDLSPILDFQPFAEVLRREKDMPVVEILVLSHRYSTVQESTPAIQVAKVMMRRDVRQVLVLRGNKLVGVISIQDFIRKVLRA
jgi:CBS domain-containing protein